MFETRTKRDSEELSGHSAHSLELENQFAIEVMPSKASG